LRDRDRILTILFRRQVYQTIAPLTSFTLAFSFLLGRAAYLQQFIYVLPNTLDSGGIIWMSFTKILLISMVIAELTIVGLMSLKKAKIATPLMFRTYLVHILMIPER
jgi:hypothetical protein